MTVGNRLRLEGALQYGAVAALCLIAALTFGMKAAKADMRINCNYGHGYSGCTINSGSGAAVPEERKVTAQDAAEAKARDDEWVARCKPTLQVDNLGVSRYVYAAKGCDVGR